MDQAAPLSTGTSEEDEVLRSGDGAADPIPPSRSEVQLAVSRQVYLSHAVDTTIVTPQTTLGGRKQSSTIEMKVS